MALCLFAVLAAGQGVQAAVVYKWTDADGVIHFSDQPVPGAEKIVTASGSAHTGWTTTNSSGGGPAKPKSASSGMEFSQFAITSPAHEETITGEQPVNVHLALEPALKPGQAITWYLNGSPLGNQPSDATSFTLPDLARGTYSIGAAIVDQTSGESKSAESVTFYVIRPSLLSPQHKNAP